MSAVRTLLIDGQNNHDWRATTPALLAMLRRDGRFDVQVMSPTVETVDQFKPDFRKHPLVVSNFTDIVKGKAWRTEVIDALCDHVEQGGGFVAYHAAASAFMKHERFWRLIAAGWRDKAGHGERFAFNLTLADAGKTHVITRDLAPSFPHARDELWHGLTGPGTTPGSGVNMNVLAHALSPLTGRDEPMLWSVEPGKGRTFVTVMGHDLEALACPNFERTFVNGCAWAARLS